MKEYLNTEIQIDERMYVLIYGGPGVGKSFFLGTIPDVVIINTDKGHKVWRSKDFTSKYPSAKFSIIEIETTGYDGWIEFEKAKEYIVKNHQEKGWKHIGIDSFTELSDMALDYAFKTNPDKKKFTGRPTLPDYGEQTKMLKELVMELRSLPLSVWVIGHEDVDKDEVTGQISRHPMTVGKFARKMGKYFDAFLYMEATTSGSRVTRRFVCQNTGITQAKSNLSLPAELVDPSYSSFMQAIKTQEAQITMTGGEKAQQGEAQPTEKVRSTSEIGKKGPYSSTLSVINIGGK